MDKRNDMLPKYKGPMQSSLGDVDSGAEGRQDPFQENDLNDKINKSSLHVVNNLMAVLPDGHLSFRHEFLHSIFVIKSSRLNVLLLFAPLAFFGSKTGILGEFQCFCCAGLALIPCAERLSLVTEHVAEHTNETIGALLNATFGNAPELLISSAALRNGFYRVVQLTLLGSVLTNLLFVFGISCLIGGLRWQTQTLRVTSGNVSVGMLLAASMGLVLPAALKLANESVSKSEMKDEINDSDVAFSRCNSLIMVVGYTCYLIFQLGSHKEEFDFNVEGHALRGSDSNCDLVGDVALRKPPRPNKFCRQYCFSVRYGDDVQFRTNYDYIYDDELDVEMADTQNVQNENATECSRRSIFVPQSQKEVENAFKGSGQEAAPNLSQHENQGHDEQFDFQRTKSKSSDIISIDDQSMSSTTMTMRCGLVWLAVVTIIISLMSGIVVDTIDGFADKSKISEVFASVIIIPFFSNIAEAVSAIIFAYKNKMDLCIGVTVGSAIQIAQLVMPLTCLWSWVMGRNMTLYFRAYETICFFLGVLCVAAVLQIGTTNWLVGCYLLSVYFMIAAGFFFHEIEDISTDSEL